LLQAAAEAFAQSGLDGATTREIAARAGLNEVTLYRHFKNKEGLLAAVVERTFEQAPESGIHSTPPLRAPLKASGEPRLHPALRTILRDYARVQHTLLEEHFPLIRAFIGEIHRHHKHEALVIRGIFIQRRQELIRDLELARRRGLVRTEVDLEMAADQFGGMIFMNLLKRSSATSHPRYPSDAYLEASVDLLARGIEMPSKTLRLKKGARALKGLRKRVK
jgi:AcrR family transcriptional regulator